jgi:hypothetical protein
VFDGALGTAFELFVFETAFGQLVITDGLGLTVTPDKFNQITLDQHRYNVVRVGDKVRIEKDISVLESDSGVVIDGKYFKMTEEPESATTIVGAGDRKITWVMIHCSPPPAGCQTVDDTPSYLPEEYISNPFRNTVTLEDDIERELIIDPDNPANVDLAQDNVQSFETPDLKLNGQYFEVLRDGADYVFREAYVARPSRYKSSNGEVTIDGKIYLVQVAGEDVSLVRKDPIESQAQEGVYLRVGGRLYVAADHGNGTYTFMDVEIPSISYTSEILDGDKRVTINGIMTSSPIRRLG